MKKMILTSLLAFLIVATPCKAVEQHAHVHGEGKGHIMIHENTISVEVIIPAETIVGFEHQPSTKEELDLINKTKEKLEKTSLFNFFEVAGFFNKTTSIPASLESSQIELTSKNSQKKIKPKMNHSQNTCHHNIDHHNDDHHGHHDHHKHDNHHPKNLAPIKEEHAEFKMTQHYQITATEKVNLIETTLFDPFPELTQLNLIVINEKTEKAIQLNPNQTKVSL